MEKKIYKRNILLLVASTMSCVVNSQEVLHPNIIFIMSDDHCTQAISSYGSKVNSTPNIDRLADMGTRFTNCFVTNSISAPSRAVMLTGMYSHFNGHIDNNCSFNGSQTTFPKLLQRYGYNTALIGKWHLKSYPTGFNYWMIHNNQGEYYNPDMIVMGDTIRYKGYATSIVTKEAIRWIKNCDTTKPFCVLVHYKAPHREWLPDTSKLKLYEGILFTEPSNLFDNYTGRGTAAKDQDMSIAETMTLNGDLKVDEQSTNALGIAPRGLGTLRNNFNRMDSAQYKVLTDYYAARNRKLVDEKLDSIELIRWKYNEYMRDYLRCVASVDDGVGQILDFLDSSGLNQNTIIVYTSDNGFYLGEHGWFDKRFMYEESLRVPLIIKSIKNVQQSVNDQLVMNLDFAPTFLNYAGLAIPDSMQGQSLKPMLDGHNKKLFRDAVYYHYYEYPGFHDVKKHYGVRTSRYKLIHFYDDIDEWELYDLKSDPNEMFNVYNNVNYLTVQKSMLRKLEEQRKKYNDL